jgi:hypothetical protein
MKFPARLHGGEGGGPQVDEGTLHKDLVNKVLHRLRGVCTDLP